MKNKKRLKFPAPVAIAVQPVDDIQIDHVLISWRKGAAEIVFKALCENKRAGDLAVVVGLDTLKQAIDVDDLEERLIDYGVALDRLPAGGDKEDKPEPVRKIEKTKPAIEPVEE